MSLDTPLNQLEMGEETASLSPGPETSSLPPADGGWAAWLFLTGSFTIETLIWGSHSCSKHWNSLFGLTYPRVSILIWGTARLL